MPSTLRLLLCVGGIYGSFLSWALVQERLSTTPYRVEGGDAPPRYFRHVVFLNTVQSSFSALAALAYIAARSPPGAAWRDAVIGASSSASVSRDLFLLGRFAF